jgi:hypothetical protein
MKVLSKNSRTKAGYSVFLFIVFGFNYKANMQALKVIAKKKGRNSPFSG